MELSEKLQIPIIITGLAKGVVPDDFPANLGSAYRASSKTAYEFMGVTDLVISIGANYPFARVEYDTHAFKYIQVEADTAKFGRHHTLDYGVWSDAKAFIQKMLDRSQTVTPNGYYKAAQEATKDWHAYLDHLMNRTDGPAQFEPLYKQINRVAEDDAIFSVDVGDNTINSFRFLKMNPKQKLVTSGLFATMGCGIPGAMAAKLSFPERQAWNIAGDGAFAMVMQDMLTEKKYNLPIINIVTSNTVLSFIRSEQEDVPQPLYGIDLEDADYAKIAEAMGVKGITVKTVAELPAAFDEAIATVKAGQPVLIDVKMTPRRSIPVEDLVVRENGQDHVTEDVNGVTHKTTGSIEDFLKKYDAVGLKPLSYYFEKNNVH
ncbi:pyruvate oxidase [Lactobacillus selangorensis]|uniref:Pyruvate oxidase n=1 Tax=Lactobacillus selangorensis TaxID=81857 RepID=A0A0R2FWC0_9LACO|nr:pyruvate oxidase [Lactobacillus selangorensis]KRN32687.1 pyruvate oxidase [Lactobacillus selangorensis]